MPGDRAHPRILTNMRAFVVVGSRQSPFTIDNISVGGARIIGTLALRLRQRVQLLLQLDTGLVNVEAEVVRIDTPDLLADQVAVRFVEPPPDVREAIREVVSRVLDQQQDEDENDDDAEMSIETDED